MFIYFFLLFYREIDFIYITFIFIENKNSKAKWNVERRFNDFYILQSKLAEFHGDFEDGTQLPPKSGVFSPRGNEFLESRRQVCNRNVRIFLNLSFKV